MKKRWVLRSDYFSESLSAILLGEKLPFDVFIFDQGEPILLVGKEKKWGPRAVRLLSACWPEVEMPDGPVKQKIKILYYEIMGIEIETATQEK